MREDANAARGSAEGLSRFLWIDSCGLRSWLACLNVCSGSPKRLTTRKEPCNDLAEPLLVEPVLVEPERRLPGRSDPRKTGSIAVFAAATVEGLEIRAREGFEFEFLGRRAGKPPPTRPVACNPPPALGESGQPLPFNWPSTPRVGTMEARSDLPRARRTTGLDPARRIPPPASRW